MKHTDILVILGNTGDDSADEFLTIPYLLSPKYQKILVKGLLVQGNNTKKDNSQALDNNLFSYKSIVGGS